MTVWARSEDSSKLDFLRFSRFSCDFYINDGCLIIAKNCQNSENVNILNLGILIKSPRSLIISPHSEIQNNCKIYYSIFYPIALNKKCTGRIGLVENIAWNNNLDIQAIMNQWKTSPEHNANILDPDVRINIHSFLGMIFKCCKKGT